MKLLLGDLHEGIVIVIFCYSPMSVTSQLILVSTLLIKYELRDLLSAYVAFPSTFIYQTSTLTLSSKEMAFESLPVKCFNRCC